MAPRRAVLLSGSLGLGHEMLVRSCASLLEASGWEVTSLDCMALLGSRLGAVGQGLFTRVVRAAPGLYDGLHFAHLRPGSPLARRMGAGAERRLVPALREVLAPDPPDLVLSVFATGAAAAAALRRATGLSARTVVLCTDVTLHRLWVAEGTDLFLATSRAAAASVRRYLPRARVAVVPPPVRPAFYGAPSKEKARAELGLPLDGPCVLVLDSVWDVAALEERVASLARHGMDVLAVAGRQRRVEARFRALAAREPRVHPFGFVEDVPRLMAAADVVVTLPGATTCSEARVIGRPLALLDIMPGHGRENLVHELETGGALPAGSRPDDLVADVEVLLRPGDGHEPGPVPLPRWEPPFASALRGLGLEVTAPADTTTEEDAAPRPVRDDPATAPRRRARPRVPTMTGA